MNAASTLHSRMNWWRLDSLNRVTRGLLWLAAVSAPVIAQGQLPSVLYTWDASGGGVSNVETWNRSFGAPNTSATLDNSIAGTLTITETSATAGGSQAFADGFNRIRESSTSASGGLDLTGLDFLEFDLGHNGAGDVNVQFYVQATPSSTYVSLGPDVPISPGVSTYQVPLSGLTPDQLVYVRTMGMNVRDHAALGNLTWTVEELRSGGVPLTVRDLVTHDVGTSEGGLQGAIANFDVTSIQGNDGGQNQTGLSHNPAGTGSLQWTDLASGNGAAVTWGNGTAWNGNTFNNRTTDLSGYTQMVVRMSATDSLNGGGTLGVQGFFQKNNFAFQSAQGGTAAQLPIDGQYHDLKFSLDGLTNMNVVDTTGINLFSHANDLVINVDNIRFRNVQFVEHVLFSWENGFEGWTEGPDSGHQHSLTSVGATHGVSALQIDRSSVKGDGSTQTTDAFVAGSVYTTTDAIIIDDLAGRINNAVTVAFDVTYMDQFPANPSFTSFYVAFDDDSGSFYQAETAGINLNGAPPGTTTTLEIPIENFLDAIPGSTKSLAVDGLSETADELSIHLISNTDWGAVYQIDNFRLITEVGQTTFAADFNGDAQVDGDDLTTWRQAFGPGDQADADGDGDSDGADFLIWQRQLGSGVSQFANAEAVPEPAAFLLALTGLGSLVMGRRLSR